MADKVASEEGCFHASYPNFTWEKMDCKVAHPRVHPVHVKPTNGAEDVTGNRNDYVAEAAGLITSREELARKIRHVLSKAGQRNVSLLK